MSANAWWFRRPLVVAAAGLVALYATLRLGPPLAGLLASIVVSLAFVVALLVEGFTRPRGDGRRTMLFATGTFLGVLFVWMLVRVITF